ncbi:MAG TPA: hypothetical protein VE953_19730 [Terriglobales bacterium]|nr:hypothetical protein [Terriglobales bacterium]
MEGGPLVEVEVARQCGEQVPGGVLGLSLDGHFPRRPARGFHDQPELHGE